MGKRCGWVGEGRGEAHYETIAVYATGLLSRTPC